MGHDTGSMIYRQNGPFTGESARLAPLANNKEKTVNKPLWLTLLIGWGTAWGGVPATPVMTFYKFNGPLDVPYYDADSVGRDGAGLPAGRLAQGSSVIPCLVMRGGQPLTDAKGTPYVGFDVVVDARTATAAATDRFKSTVAQRRAMTVENHHCAPGTDRVIDVRNLYPLDKAPYFDPPPARLPPASTPVGRSQLDQIVRAFHNSPDCRDANAELMGRRYALQRSWEVFAQGNRGRWPASAIEQAKHLDYTMRTAIFEGHLDRGCNAYGGCERNIIALSIRNRGRESCARGQGCRSPGDFQGVSSDVSQYNIWDEYLTQVSGLTSCFLRDDLAPGKAPPGAERYAKLQGMYEQNVGDIERILFGTDADLEAVFPDNALSALKSVKHYYHAPAMGKCFPRHDRMEYISGAVASRGGNFILLANTRIHVDERAGSGYYFRDFVLDAQEEEDVIDLVDRYPGFVVDGRKVDLKPSAGCPPYGIPRGCSFGGGVGRYRKTPSWLEEGRPIEITCRLKDRGASCQGSGTSATARVGGLCDTQMRPVAGVR